MPVQWDVSQVEALRQSRDVLADELQVSTLQAENNVSVQIDEDQTLR